MITATIEHAVQNRVGARIEKALAWLRDTDLENLADGRYDIEGDAIFANVMQLETAAPADKNYEAHRRYADIHYCISGREYIGSAPIESCEEVTPFDTASDIGFYTAEAGSESWVMLRPHELCIDFPSDAHKPGCYKDAPSQLKKVCVKVLVEE